jgi:hypothetical protein
VREPVTAATAQVGTHAPLVAALTAMSLEVTVTSTNGDTPAPTVHLEFHELPVNGQQQSTAPTPNTTVSLDNGGKAILNVQQPRDTGIDVTAEGAASIPSDRRTRSAGRGRCKEAEPAARARLGSVHLFVGCRWWLR